MHGAVFTVRDTGLLHAGNSRRGALRVVTTHADGNRLRGDGRVSRQERGRFTVSCLSKRRLCTSIQTTITRQSCCNDAGGWVWGRGCGAPAEGRKGPFRGGRMLQALFVVEPT